jgi:hypothetical protein
VGIRSPPATPADRLFRYVQTFPGQAEAGIRQAVTDAEFFRITARLFRAPDRDAGPRIRTATRIVSTSSPGCGPTPTPGPASRGTAWAGYQAIAEYVDHHSPARTAKGTQVGPRVTEPAGEADRPRQPTLDDNRTRADQDPRLATRHHPTPTCAAGTATDHPADVIDTGGLDRQVRAVQAHVLDRYRGGRLPPSGKSPPHRRRVDRTHPEPGGTG